MSHCHEKICMCPPWTTWLLAPNNQPILLCFILNNSKSLNTDLCCWILSKIVPFFQCNFLFSIGFTQVAFHLPKHCGNRTLTFCVKSNLPITIIWLLACSQFIATVTIITIIISIKMFQIGIIHCIITLLVFSPCKLVIKIKLILIVLISCWIGIGWIGIRWIGINERLEK